MRNKIAHYARTSIPAVKGCPPAIAEQRKQAINYVGVERARALSFYADVDTGSSLEPPGLAAMLMDIGNGEVGEVLVDDLDRLSRVPEDVAELLTLFQSFNVAVRTIGAHL